MKLIHCQFVLSEQMLSTQGTHRWCAPHWKFCNI